MHLDMSRTYFICSTEGFHSSECGSITSICRIISIHSYKYAFMIGLLPYLTPILLYHDIIIKKY